MEWENTPESSNVEDRRGQSTNAGMGGGGISGGTGGLGIGVIVIVLIISYFTGINPSVLMGGAQILVGNGGGQVATNNPAPRNNPAPPRQNAAAPTTDRMTSLVRHVLGETEAVWSKVLPAQKGVRYTPATLVLYDGAPDHPCERVRMGEVGPVAGALDLYQPGAGDVVVEPADRVTVMGERGGAPTEHGGDGESRDVERHLAGPDVGELGGQRRSVVPPGLLGVLGEPVPGRVADHASEEPLGHQSRILVDRTQGSAGTGSPTGGPCRQPGQRRLVGGDGQDRPRPAGTERSAESDVAAVAVTDHHGRPVVDHRQQVLDVAVERVVTHDPACRGRPAFDGWRAV